MLNEDKIKLNTLTKTRILIKKKMMQEAREKFKSIDVSVFPSDFMNFRNSFVKPIRN